MDYELIEARASEDCGCPEEVAVIGMFDVIIHLEEDGTGDMFMDCGDWEHDVTFSDPNMTMELLREKAVNHIATLPDQP